MQRASSRMSGRLGFQEQGPSRSRARRCILGVVPGWQPAMTANRSESAHHDTVLALFVRPVSEDSVAKPLTRGSRLVLASHNPGKLREIADLLRPCGVELVSAAALALAEPEETAPDFAGNARLKATAAAQESGLPALADDSGFCVAALGGAPGVLSARWAGAAKDFGAAMERVHAEMGETRDRRAWFVCTLCLAWPDGRSATYLGRVEGETVWPPRGGRGFGYDPVFVPLGGRLTYGEMDPDEKHATSHRARAMAQFTAACLSG
jgi:XTP/dITP diphosphohydrolase